MSAPEYEVAQQLCLNLWKDWPDSFAEDARSLQWRRRFFWWPVQAALNALVYVNLALAVVDTLFTCTPRASYAESCSTNEEQPLLSVLEGGVLLLLLVGVGMQARYKRLRSVRQDPWLSFVAAALVLSLLSLCLHGIVAAAVGNTGLQTRELEAQVSWTVRAMLRPVPYLHAFPSVRSVYGRLVRLVPTVMGSLLVVMLFIAIFGLFGRMLVLDPTMEGNDFALKGNGFDGIAEACQTTFWWAFGNNGPSVGNQVGDPGYKEGAFWAIFWTVFTALESFYLVQIVTAVVVNSHSQFVAKGEVARRKWRQRASRTIYKILHARVGSTDSKSVGDVDAARPATATATATDIDMNKGKGKGKGKGEGEPGEPGEGEPGEGEGEEMDKQAAIPASVLTAFLEDLNWCRFGGFRTVGVDGDVVAANGLEQALAGRTRPIRRTNRDAPRRQRLKRFIESVPWAHTLRALALSNAVILIVESEEHLEGGAGNFSGSPASILDLIVVVAYLLDAFAAAVVFVPPPRVFELWRSPAYLRISLTLLVLVLFATHALTKTELHVLALYYHLHALLLLHLIDVARVIPPVDEIYEVLTRVAPRVRDLLLGLISVLYSWAVLGVVINQAGFTKDNQALQNLAHSSGALLTMNFNSLPSGLYTLTMTLYGNNIEQFAQGFFAVGGWPSLIHFMIAYMFCQLVGANVFVSVLIDVHMEVATTARKKLATVAPVAPHEPIDPHPHHIRS